MSAKIKSMRINGSTAADFKKAFIELTGEVNESEGEKHAFTGNIDKDGRFIIIKNGRGYGKGADYESRLIGTVTEEKDTVVVDYETKMSPIFIACYFIIGLLFAGSTILGIIKAVVEENFGAVLIAPFIAVAFIIMTIIMIVKPECRAIEKCLDEIAEKSLKETKND